MILSRAAGSGKSRRFFLHFLSRPEKLVAMEELLENGENTQDSWKISAVPAGLGPLANGTQHCVLG
jgi:hypothetical protein